MIRSSILALGALVTLSAPAFAEYYVIHGPDRHCQVVERYNPEERDVVRVGPLSFGTREEAEREVHVICRDDGYYREDEPVEHHEYYERRERY